MQEKNYFSTAGDSKTTIEELKETVKKFCEERDWDQFHNAKDLAIALSIEVSELLEIFRWKSLDEIEQLFLDDKKRGKIEDEMADIFYFLLRIAQKYGVDLSRSLEKKMDKNKNRYPIEKARGSNKKYNEF
ncbi:MAG: nucleotide pyrophosphohydrolase [Thermotogae bacterium]|nr:MAG: nucleotide pyrophosphohydrolase [Thermotogota bacterium]